jgi:hypothetical protein
MVFIGRFSCGVPARHEKADRANSSELYVYERSSLTSMTKLHSSRTPWPIIGKITGHMSLETTMKHYVPINPEMLREVTERMNAVHDARPTQKGDAEFIN